MFDNLKINFNTYYQEHILNYMGELYKYPIKLIPMILVLLLNQKLFYDINKIKRW